ncbi:MAG: hypothetical protein GF330_11095 [Candidatus Eisenbacteria bacterium]|nr:hypothetical protein [Candidatus Eisenbacteria bacterium]
MRNPPGRWSAPRRIGPGSDEEGAMGKPDAAGSRVPQVTRAELAELAELAGLEIPAREIPRLRGDLGRILAYVAAIERIAPAADPAPPPDAAPQDLRDDVPADGPNGGALRSAAPRLAGDYFVVPPVLPPRERGEGRV